MSPAHRTWGSLPLGHPLSPTSLTCRVASLPLKNPWDTRCQDRWVFLSLHFHHKKVIVCLSICLSVILFIYFLSVRLSFYPSPIFSVHHLSIGLGSIHIWIIKELAAVPLLRCSCGSVVEHCVSSAKVVGSISREHTYCQKKCITWMYCKSLWIKASAKCIHLNVNVNECNRLNDITQCLKVVPS